MSSEVLDAAVVKIKYLDNVSSPINTKLCYKVGHTDYAEIPVPPTDKARQLLRDLLVEIGRHECEIADNTKATFEKACECEPGRKGDFGV